MVLTNIEAPRQPLSLNDAIDALRQEFQRLDADQKVVFSSFESLLYGMLNVAGAAGTGKTHVCLLIVIMACLGMAVDDDDNQNTMAQALVCGVTNAQVDELCERFDQMIKRCRQPLKVARLGTMGRELNNATSRGFVKDEATRLDPETGRPSATFDHEVAQIMHAYRENKSAQGKIHVGVYSVSEIAYAKLDAYINNNNNDGSGEDEYSKTLNRLRSIYQLRKMDHRMFADDLAKEYRQLWKELIVQILADAGICVATPVAAKQLADMSERPSEPRIIWSDDVGLTTEASGLAPFAFFPETRFGSCQETRRAR